MGKRKHLDAIELLLARSPVVDFRTIDRIVKSSQKRSCSGGQYTKLLVSNLLGEGKIKRLTKGYYTTYDDISLAVFCFKPSYLGLQSALSIHNLWEQETTPIIITSKKVRTGIREVMGGNVQIRRTECEKIFGYDLIKDGDFYLPYSDIEKTVIDMAAFNQHISQEVLRGIKKKINTQTLRSYLKKYPERIKNKVLNLIDEADRPIR